MKRIITLTLNPAFDLHYRIKGFMPYKENFVSDALIEAGGKGINISRALSAGGYKNTAFAILGKENSREFEAKLKADNVNYRAVYTDGRIRENITLHSEGVPETRISFDNFSVNAEILDELYEEMKPYLDGDTVVAFSGRIPKGITVGQSVDFLKKLKSHGVLLSVDSGSYGIEQLAELSPLLIKPNEQEIEKLIGKKVTNREEALEAAKALKVTGAENIIVSLGGEGFVHVSGEKAFAVTVPKIEPLSTVGAGDSSVAGFVGAYADGAGIEECLRTAASFGTAACLTEGSAPPKAETVKEIYSKINVTAR